MKFDEIYAKVQTSCDSLNDKDCLKIHVASSREDANADSLFDSFQSRIDAAGINAVVIKTGSFGYCDLEPLVWIQRPDGSSVIYNNSTPDSASDLVKGLEKGDPRRDLALCRIGGEDLKEIPPASDLPLFQLQNRVVLRNCGYIDPENINHYMVRSKGYTGLARVISMERNTVIEELRHSGLGGWSDTEFETADQGAVCRDADGLYVVCNAVERDPRARAAYLLLESDPYSVFEGLLLVAYALNTSHCLLYVDVDSGVSVERLNQALENMRKLRLLGEEILGSSFSCEIETREVSASVLCGDESAIQGILGGKKAMPYMPPPDPGVEGLKDKSTVIYDPETLAKVSAFFQKGGSGAGMDISMGSRVITLTGDTNHPYVVEVNLGTTLRNIVEDIGGGASGGKGIKAILVGGPAGTYYSSDSLDIPIPFQAVGHSGSMIGSGTIEVIGRGSCVVQMARKILTHVLSHSCGKCVFCREGTYQMADILKDILEHSAKPQALDLLIELGEAMKTGCTCDFGRTAPNPVLSSIKLFRSDYEAHIKGQNFPGMKK